MARVTYDDYPTPQLLADAITTRISSLIPSPRVVIEPSCGAGAFLSSAATTWPTANLIGVDIGDYRAQVGALGTGAMFVQDDWLNAVKTAGIRIPPGTLVLGNPPYSNNQPQYHVEATLDTAPAGTRIAFLLRLAMLGGTKRAKTLWARQALKWLVPIAGRPSFTPDGGSDPAEYALFIWEAGHQGDFTGGLPITWKTERTAA